MHCPIESITLYFGLSSTARREVLCQLDQDRFMRKGLNLRDENGSTRFEIKFQNPQPLERIECTGPKVLAVHFHSGNVHLKLGPADQETLANFNIKWEKVCIEFDQPATIEAKCFSASVVRAGVKLTSNQDFLRKVPEDMTLLCKDGKSVKISSAVAEINCEMTELKKHQCLDDPKTLDLTDFAFETVSKVKTIILDRVIPQNVTPEEVRLMHYLLIEGREAAWLPLVESMTLDTCCDVAILADAHKKERISAAVKQFIDKNISRFEIVDPYALKAAFAVKRSD